MGIIADHVADELYSSGLIIGAKDTFATPMPQLEFITKVEMTEFCIRNGIEIKKSWSKGKIFAAIQQVSPQLSDQLVKNLPKINEIFWFNISPDYHEELNAVTVFSENLFPVYQALCFVCSDLEKC